MTIGTGNNWNVIQPRQVFNQSMPSMITCVPIQVDLSVNTVQEIDLTNTQWTGKINAVQTAFIDNSNASGALTLLVNITGQKVIVPPFSQGYFPLLVPNPPVLTVSNLTGSQSTGIYLLNVPMPLAVWNVGGTGAVDPGTGALLVSDVILESAVSGGAINVSGAVGTLVSQSRTTPNPAASFTVLPVNFLRRFFMIKAPETGDLWVNFMGGTASVDGLDCIKIPAGSVYESPLNCIKTLITGYCTATAVNMTAFEG